jgi:hypothetical protein
VVAAAPAPFVHSAPVAVAAAPHHHQVVAIARAPQAGDFGPLVTKEAVLAPVRTHTHITPQVTQVQPEVTVRKVVQNVDVPTPVFQTQVIHQVAQPIVQAAPAVHTYSAHHGIGLAHQNVISHHGPFQSFL